MLPQRTLSPLLQQWFATFKTWISILPTQESSKEFFHAAQALIEVANQQAHLQASNSPAEPCQPNQAKVKLNWHFDMLPTNPTNKATHQSRPTHSLKRTQPTKNKPQPINKPPHRKIQTQTTNQQTNTHTHTPNQARNPINKISFWKKRHGVFENSGPLTARARDLRKRYLSVLPSPAPLSDSVWVVRFCGPVAGRSNTRRKAGREIPKEKDWAGLS